ncbi:MAG TPA: cyclic nucleotide-binding domain-containing protein [Nitrospirota bacterium]|nr:cyclic nucleotide-binding domain-containing protein [Nitrospirota bacterium]
MTNLELLQKTMLFRGSKYEELELVLGLFQERQLRTNAVIFSEKASGEALYIVKSGKVRISMMAGDGSEANLLLLGPGEFFGELSLIQEDVRLVSARADTNVEILLLTRKDFQVLQELAPRTASRALIVISRLLAMRVKAYSDRLKDLLVL